VFTWLQLTTFKKKPRSPQFPALWRPAPILPRGFGKMVFLPPKESGQLDPIPDNIPISEFMLNERYGRVRHASSRDPYTCGITGKSYSSKEVANRVDSLARSLSKEFGWAPNEGSEWDKTLAVFALNTVGGVYCIKKNGRALILSFSRLDRFLTPILGRSQTGRCSHSRQRIILRRRADASAA
jgi:hypothetical protein